jgi:hypothetical protein
MDLKYGMRVWADKDWWRSLLKTVIKFRVKFGGIY